MTDPKPNDINIIDQFLQAFSPEVGGRSSDTLTAEVESQLQKLSSGQLTDPELTEISRELLVNDAAINFLLAQVRGG